MKTLTSLYTNHMDMILSMIVGIMAASGIILTVGMEIKWLIFVILVIISLTVLLAFPEREKFLLYVAVFFLPIGLDFHLFHLQTSFIIRPISGFRISAYDLPFFFLILFWMFRVISDPSIRVKFYPLISIPFILIWGISMAGITRAVIPSVISASVLWILFKNWIVFLYIANNLRERQTIYSLVGILLLSGIIQALLGLAQHFTGGTLGAGIFGEAEKSFLVMKAGSGSVSRVAGTLGHPNKLAVFLGMLIQVNLALFFAPLAGRIKCVLAVSFSLMAAAMLLTYSRGGWLGLAVGGSLTFYWCLAKLTQHKVVSALLLIIFIITVSLSAIFLVESVRQRLFEEDYGTAKTRIPMGIVALNMIRQNPWLGVGLTNYVSIATHYDTTSEAISYRFPRPVHNEFLLIAAELGLPALALFLAIFSVTFHLLLSIGRSREDPIIPYLAIGFFGGWIAWCVHHQFEYLYTFLVLPVWVYYFGFIQALHDYINQPENH